jgi:hypothetical protein
VKDVRDSNVVSKARVALGCGFLAAGLLGCSGDGAPSTDKLAKNLAILEDEQGLSHTEVVCVAQKARAGLSDDALKDLGDDVEKLASTKSMATMSPASQQALTRAIAACAGG